MKSEQNELKKALQTIGEDTSKEKSGEYKNLAQKLMGTGVMPKEAFGLSEAMVEGIYGQAYRLYNTGKYKEAAQLFRMLLMMDTTEAKYSMGFAACFHMLKEYQNAINAYTVCGFLDPENPIPHFHASDCYIQMGDTLGALVALDLAIKRAGEKPEFQMLKDRALLTKESLKNERENKSKN
jgi:type III secretion system low calcium response chaperone LcrH/SycD